MQKNKCNDNQDVSSMYSQCVSTKTYISVPSVYVMSAHTPSRCDNAIPFEVKQFRLNTTVTFLCCFVRLGRMVKELVVDAIGSFGVSMGCICFPSTVQF